MSEKDKKSADSFWRGLGLGCVPLLGFGIGLSALVESGKQKFGKGKGWTDSDGEPVPKEAAGLIVGLIAQVMGYWAWLLTR